MCRHYDTGKAKQCREPMAEEVTKEVADKTRANFCEWFQPSPTAFDTPQTQAATPRAALDTLFSTPANAQDTVAKPDPRSALDQLFKS